jgi:hypothetical protein
MRRDDIGHEERVRVKSIMPFVAVALTFALSALPVAAAANTSGEISIVTTVDQPTGPGAPVRQTATVTDTGRLPLVDLRIHLDLTPRCEWFVSSLVPGETTTVTCTGTSGDTDRVITAIVYGHDLLGGWVSACSTTTLRPPHPAVRLDVTATPSLAVPGQSVRYTVSVTNSGDVPLDHLAVAAIGSRWCDRSVPGTLAVGATAAVECTTATGRRDWSTTFRLSGRDTFGDPVAAATTVGVTVVVPSLTLELSGPAGPIPAEQDALITVRLTDTSSVALSDLRITGTPVACAKDLPSLAGGAAVTYTCSVPVGTRTVVVLTATALPTVDGTPVPGAESVTEHSTLVLPPAARPTPTTPEPAPTEPAPRIAPAPAVARPWPAPQAPTAVAPSTPSTSTSPAPAAPLRPPVTDRATGPLAKPGRTAAVIAVLAVLVMTVSVGALAAATRPGK